MVTVLFLIYIVVGCWAADQTIFAYKYEPFGVKAFCAFFGLDFNSGWNH